MLFALVPGVAGKWKNRSDTCLPSKRVSNASERHVSMTIGNTQEGEQFVNNQRLRFDRAESASLIRKGIRNLLLVVLSLAGTAILNADEITLGQTQMLVDSASCDDFANARPLSGANGQATFDNTGYSREPGEPVHSDTGTDGETSAWAVWTAPESGDWTFFLSGVIARSNGSMDTQLAIYTGSSVDALTRIAANDDVNAAGDDYSSRVTFPAVKGTTYYIAMDSYRGSDFPGTLALRWKEGFVHYAKFEYSPIFLASSGGYVEMGVESSAPWSLVECSDWITPRAATGESCGSLVFDAMSNTTGRERNGYVTIQAGNSDFATLSIRQHAMDFVTTKEEAVEEAWRTNKRILLVRGREKCGNTSSTLFYSIPSSTVKPLLDAGYILWYSNCDRQTDASRYSAGGYLPTVAILDPSDMAAFIVGISGRQSESELKSFLDANSSWSGLPAPTGVELTGMGAVIAETPYSMKATFADGTVLSLKHSVIWTIQSGSAATITKEGVLVPVAGRTGTVTVSGTVVMRGQTYTRTMDVRVIDPATVTGVSVAGPEVIDLYDMSSGRFAATVTCSDGTTAVVAPKWTIEETSVTNAVISAEGLVTFPNPIKYGSKASRLRVTAECNGFVAMKEADVWGWRVSVSSWTTPQRVVWPGQTAKIVPITVTWWRHGVTEAPTTDFDGVDFSIYGYVNNSTYMGPEYAISSEDGPGLQIPFGITEPEGYCNVCALASATRAGQTIAYGSYSYFKYLPSAPSQTVTVTFVNEGGEPETHTSKYAAGYTYGYMPELIRTGYYCYWYTAREGGTQVASTNTVPAVDTTLYARWRPRYYCLKFDANGGEGSMPSQNLYYDTPATIRARTFKREGYLFQGWALSPDGAVVYQDGEEVLNLRDSYDTITLYAVWKPVAPETVPQRDKVFVNASETVAFSHEAEDSIILYTLDGSDPTKNGREYKGPFSVYKSCTIRAVAYGAGQYSDEVSVTLTRADDLFEASNLYGYTIETDSVAPWMVDTTVSHDGVSSVRSGAIGDGGMTYLMASVEKAGTVSFWWKARCEEPDEEDGEDGYYDYCAFLVDDVVKARIAGNDTGWRLVSVDVPTDGKHILRWEYRKDGATSYAPDRVWLDQIQWNPADGSGCTLTSPEKVPYSWLAQYGLGVASSDFEAATKATAANGRNKVWECYVAGISPTDETSQFTAKIEIRDGEPVVTWEPDLNAGGAAMRTYKVYGSETLENGGDWEYPVSPRHKFFKVSVEMP